MGNASSRGFAQGRPTCAPPAQPLEVRTNGDGESDWDNRILYCGYRLDPETGTDGQGIMHVRHRPYHCTIARWTVRDMLGYVDGMGLYEYTMAAPVTLVDPLGLEGEMTGWDAAMHYVNAMDAVNNPKPAMDPSPHYS